MFWPCETRTSTCRSFATISSGLYRFLAIAVLLDVKDIPQVGPLQWGWITSGGTLAKAVTEAGGLGIIGFGCGNQERIDQEFRAAGNARVGCGFITWSLARQPHLLARALDHKPVAVMLSFGDARPFAAAIKDAGAALISQVQTVAQAMEAIDIGADIIVAQGTEAGGHGATRSTLALVPAVVDAVRERN